MDENGSERLLQRDLAEKVLLAAAKLQDERQDRVSVGDLERMAQEAGIEGHYVRSALQQMLPAVREAKPVAAVSDAVSRPDVLRLALIASVVEGAYLAAVDYQFGGSISIAVSMAAAAYLALSAEPTRKNQRHASVMFALVAGVAAVLWFALLRNRFEWFQRGHGPYLRLVVALTIDLAVLQILFIGRRLYERWKELLPLGRTGPEAI